MDGDSLIIGYLEPQSRSVVDTEINILTLLYTIHIYDIYHIGVGVLAIRSPKVNKGSTIIKEGIPVVFWCMIIIAHSSRCEKRILFCHNIWSSPRSDLKIRLILYFHCGLIYLFLCWFRGKCLSYSHFFLSKRFPEPLTSVPRLILIIYTLAWNNILKSINRDVLWTLVFNGQFITDLYTRLSVNN